MEKKKIHTWENSSYPQTDFLSPYLLRNHAYILLTPHYIFFASVIALKLSLSPLSYLLRTPKAVKAVSKGRPSHQVRKVKWSLIYKTRSKTPSWKLWWANKLHALLWGRKTHNRSNLIQICKDYLQFSHMVCREIQGVYTSCRSSEATTKDPTFRKNPLRFCISQWTISSTSLLWSSAMVLSFAFSLPSPSHFFSTVLNFESLNSVRHA